MAVIMNQKDLKTKNYLDELVEQFNKPEFIEDDPISIPKRFKKLQDIEITGFWVAMLSWGQRVTIINKANELIDLMDGAPYEFITQHEEKDRARFVNFKHRTFQYIDTLYFLEFFQEFYKNNKSLEMAFIKGMSKGDDTVEQGLKLFHKDFFSLAHSPKRTRKHVSTPERNSRCKRLNMFLRWMVRKDNAKVDFGLWKKIDTSQLLIPLDVHVERVARSLNLVERKQNDWKTVMELTSKLKKFCPEDPVKYDFALFGLGVLQKKDASKILRDV